MIRRTNTTSGAHLLRRAATLAKAIRTRYGYKREVHDGYLVEGRRSDRRLFASVIEPPGRLTLVGPYDGMLLAFVPCPPREFFSPLYPLRDSRPAGDYSQFGEREPLSGAAFALGTAPSGSTATLAIGNAHVGARAIYYPTVIHTGQLTTGGLASSQTWLRVLATGIGASPAPRSFFVHQSVIRSIAPGYDLIPRNTANMNDWGSLPIASVCELDGLVVVAVQVYRGRSGDQGAEKVTQGVVVLAVDPALRQLAWSAFLPAEQMPEGFVPEQFELYGNTTWAQSSFYHLTAARRPDGTVQVVAFYQVERRTTTDDNEPAIVPVMAVADMTFRQGAAAVQMLHADVRAPASCPVVAEMGAAPGYVLRPLMPHVVDNKVIVEAFRFKRAATWSYTPGGPDFYAESPYSHVFYDGEQISTGLALGSMEINTPSISSDIGSLLDPNQLSGKAGEGLYAYKGRGLESRGVGVTFVKSGAAKFEPLMADWSGTIMGELLSVTCPQQEVRGEAGELVMPCTLVAMFTRGAEDETVIGLRKGPIWHEDGAVADHMSYWRFYPLNTWAQLGAVYTGNPLVLAEHGHMFEAG